MVKAVTCHISVRIDFMLGVSPDVRVHIHIQIHIRTFICTSMLNSPQCPVALYTTRQWNMKRALIRRRP